MLDIFLNIFSELIGIGLTVFLVDRLIKRSEERRWQQSKNIAYGRLLRIISAATIYLSQVCTYPLKRYMYKFGKVYASSTEFDIFPESFEQDAVIEMNIRPKLAEMAVEHKTSSGRMLINFSEELDDELLKTSQLLDPELLTLLMELRASLEKMGDIELALEIGAIASVGGDEAFEYGIWKVLSLVVDLQKVIESRATEKNKLKYS
ncbi:MAG: hypothetical protein ACOYZ6_15770 [Chloroflexota bacterium]